MAKKTDIEKWYEEKKEILQYLCEISFMNDEHYKSLSEEEKFKAMVVAFDKELESKYPDTIFGIKIREAYNIPPLSLPDLKIDLEGYTIYLEYKEIKEELFKCIERRGGINFDKIRNGELIQKEKGKYPDIEDIALRAWVNHKDKLAFIVNGKVTISQFKELFKNQVPDRNTIEEMTRNYLPWVKELSKEDYKAMAEEYFPEYKDDIIYICRWGDEKYQKKIEGQKYLEKHKAEYNPKGRRVKVRDMKVGYLYTFTDMSLECYYKYVDEWYDSDPHYHPFDEIPIMNAGLVRRPLHEVYRDSDKILVQLCWVQKREEVVIAPSKTGRGLGSRRTGNIIWVGKGRNPGIERPMNPDDEVIEVYPFPIGIYRDDGYMEWIPNPDKWERIPADTPYNWKIDHVDVWEETEIHVLIFVGIISFIFACGGAEGFFMAIGMWVLVGAAMRTRHNRKRREVWEEREKRGVRGPGLDDHFRYK